MVAGFSGIAKKNIRLADNVCKRGNVNEIAQFLHLLIAEDHFRENKIAEAKQELKLSEQLAIGVTVKPEVELRRQKLAGKLKTRK